MNNTPKRNWFGFWVHFLFGAVFGAVMGLWVWGRAEGTNESMLVGILYIGGGALFFGFVAGWFKDKFWEDFRY